MSAQDPSNANKRLVVRLSMVVIAMFGFGFALVPLYDALCDITGLNGKTGEIKAEVAKAYEIDEDRWITVEFLSQVNSELHWEFGPAVRQMKVRPGELTDAIFIAENKTPNEVVGQAIPSIVPNIAARYFNKTECFCFTQQTLKPRERREMPLRFVIDPAIPDDVNSVALSYSIFKISESKPSQHDALAQVSN